MKKLYSAILVLTLLLLPLGASAATLESQHTVNNVVYMGAASNTYVVSSSDGYQIFNAAGEAVGPVWGNMGPKQNGMYYQVLYNGGVSMVSADGTLVLPENYFGFVSTGEDWMFGVLMEETTDENPDYTSNAGKKMNVLRADVVHGNTLVGSLTREQYSPSATAGVIGSYLYILHADGRCLWFDAALNQTAEIQITEKPQEYTYVDGVYIHTPTQQAAFTASCTLTAEQVEQAAMVVGNELLDLQGNVIVTLPETGVYSAKTMGDYFYADTGSGRGLWNLKGEQVIPNTYAYIGDSYSSFAVFFPTGYQAALDRAGDLFFFDEKGDITASVTGMDLSYFNCDGFLKSSPILGIETEDGYLLASATHGLLPDLYEDVDIGYTGVQLVAVQKDGLWGCVDMAGNTIVPVELSDVPSVSDDGSLVVGKKIDGSWGVYEIGYDN